MDSTNRSKKHREMVKEIIVNYQKNFIKYASKLNEKEITNFQSSFSENQQNYIKKVWSESN